MRTRLVNNLGFMIIFLIALIFRIYGINWDQGYHFHPDERMLIMVADKVHLFSQLDPNFFNYGSLPIYVLKGVSQLLEILTNQHIANYDGMLIVGRYLSIFADLLVLIFIYKITILLFDKKNYALWASAIYAFTFFAIQNTHFFISDTFLNLFGTALLYLLIRYIKHPSYGLIGGISLVFAAALTTKFTAILFIVPIGFVLFLPLLYKRDWDTILDITLRLVSGFTVTLLFTFLFMPYAFIDWPTFYHDIKLQLQMNNDPYTFPYTLQYVGTLPYVYYLKNIALWGAGPIIFGLFIVGIVEHLISFRWHHLKNHLLKKDHLTLQWICLYLFYIVFFLILGRSAVKFMRYLLPLYPFIAIIASYGMASTIASFEKRWRVLAHCIIWFAIGIWTIAFVMIYAQVSTRIRASQWIGQNIPKGSTLAVEHWDDRIPIFDPGYYEYVEMTLYERPDDRNKWNILNQNLKEADYIIIASNRLYTPLTRLRDCDTYKFCYPYTAKYYDELFSESNGFYKIAEFTSYPNLKIGPWSLEIVDDHADESFTVYDHPKIMIFKKG